MERSTPTLLEEIGLLPDVPPVSTGFMAVHHRFERQARRSPQSVAVSSGDRRLTYGELDRWANALACQLQDLGVGPEVRVGICLPRSPELLAAVLAVLKAGGAYVALDSSIPKERLTFQLEDCGAPVLLTGKEFAGIADAAEAIGIRCLFPAEEQPSGEVLFAPAPAEILPGHLAYVIYTSGSTGLPKGVEISHGSLLALADWHVLAFSVTAADRATLLAGVGFDASVWEMWPYLAMGAALAIVPDEIRSSPPVLIDWLTSEGVTITFLPTPLAEAVLPLAWPAETALRILLTGGDRLHLAPPASVRFALVNNYGPTEGTVVATSGVVLAGTEGLPSIGQPLPHVKAVVADPGLTPVPSGASGELLIGGAGLARGYLGRPDLTAAAFVPDPSVAGERLYRTGDLVRTGSEGELEFLGRIDDQVKIQGHRIELGEVEAALARHPAVREGVVTVCEDDEGSKRLVAYVVAESSGSALRGYLAENLPDYMVPSGFVFLESLPYTPSGKVDRRALPEPGELSRAEPFAAPRTAVEARLAELWSEVLRCGPVGIHGSFFELGGHSLSATRILARVTDLFGVELPLRALLETPTVAELAARLASATSGSALPLRRQDRSGQFPLSFAQEGLWFLDRLEPGRPTYNVGSAVSLRGPLDPAALAGALTAVVGRHEALRTRFVEIEGEPRQEALPASPAALPQVDLSSFPKAEAELERLFLLQARQRFELASGPLFRSTLVRLGTGRHVLLLGVHHIVFDGWSEDLFWRELSTFYTGGSSSLPELAVQYSDFAVWQRLRLTSGLLREQVEWWRGRLEGIAPLDLPTDRPRPATQTFRGDELLCSLPAPLAEAMRGLARRQGATAFMAFLAAFSALLFRQSAQESFAVGIPEAGRSASGLEGVIGMFVNMLALHADLGGRPSFRKLLERTRETALASFAHQEMPFDRLVHELNPERDLSRNPIFQVGFQVVPEARRLPRLAGIEATDPGFHAGTVKFDLDVELEDGGEAISGHWVYSTDLFDAATVLRLSERFRLLSEAVVAAPDRPLVELTLLSDSERQQLMDWNDTGMPVAAAPVHVLFEEQARRSPQALAVTAGGEELTYGELLRRATRLACTLRRLGVGPEVRVGICLGRSLDLTVSVLAVLKAGGAYVALDPTHPEDRLEFQLRDSRARVLLAREPRPRALADSLGILCLTPGEEPDLPGTDDLPEPAVSPGNLAYIIYTSGSTGRPKGVELSHRGLSNLSAGHVRDFGVTRDDRATLIAGVGFDASVWEVWPYLTMGASLHVVPEEVRTAPEGLRDWLVEQRITSSWLPVLICEGILGLEWPRETYLRIVLTGGDRVHLHPSASVPFALINAYGPTEGTVISTWGAVPIGGRDGWQPAIGRAIPNVRCYAGDAELRSVPVGVPGELLVGGASLARGYVGRSDLTAERFVPDTFSGLSGERLYRTGDLVRFLPNGDLDFLGRIDHQVKIRGVRVELGEIEAALVRHPEVREAAVLALAGVLVAYVVTDADPSGFADFLRETLPEAMIPAAFMPLPELPLNASGKVDRKALARMAPPSAEATVAPANPVEELIARLWEEILERAPVRSGDNFFHLGGHSLLATRVLSRIREAFGVDLPLQAIFASPTVASLARAVSAARKGDVEFSLPPLRPVDRSGLLPLSFPQQRLWFVDRLAPDNPTYNMPAAFRLRGPLDQAALRGALTELVRRHEALRTRFVEVDGQPWQEILPAAFPLPEVDLRTLDGELRETALARLMEEEAGRSFDLGNGPLLRGQLVCLSDEEHALLLTLHHIASDGWSEEILSRDLGSLYAAIVADRPAPREPRIQYADFAVWQRAWPAEFLDRQLAWWTGQLDGLATLEVPTDHPRPPVQTFRGAWETVTLPEELTLPLRELTRSRRTTLFMTVLAAWQALFHRITGQTDVAVGSPVANRNRPEIEDLIGFFINMLALRTDFGGDPSFGEVVERVRRVALEAYDHADVPFERLVDELSPGRDLSRQPVVQVMFVLQSTVPAPPSLPGLEVTAIPQAVAIAKFDLTLGLFDSGTDLNGWIEYSTDLFDRTTIARLAGQFLSLVAGVAAAEEVPVSQIELLLPAERHQLLREWSDTPAPFPENALLHQFFEAAADREPRAPAVVWEGRELTYAGLEERANRIAHLLRQRGVQRGTPVGVWMERSVAMIAGIVGVLKAGGYYVPLDPAWPADRVETILGDTESPAILTRRAHLGRVLEMQWRLPSLGDVICLDVDASEPTPEPVDTESVRAVFDLVAQRATDRVTAGGFVSSFTGQPFSDAEVDEYLERVLTIAEPWIGPDKRVLEIGSGSGLLLWEIAPRVRHYVGLDPSRITQEKNRVQAAKLGLDVELPVGFAHEIAGWPEQSFDLVLLASTAQFFPGPLYLEQVVKQAMRLLAPGGALVIADVPDARRQEDLQAAIEEHRGSRQDPQKVLSVDEDFFRDLGASVLHREKGFDNELRFRYDVVLTAGSEPVRERRKRLWTSWQVERCPAERPEAVNAPEDLAYVIHTSGSTGHPKGIVVQHRPVANLIAWINPRLDVRSSDRVLFVTSLCFDLSVWDIFGVLAAGGCIHVASEEELQDAERLVQLLLEEPVTIWDSAPAALVRLAPLFPSEPAIHSRLRRVMLSGDWIPVTLPDRVRTAFPSAQVMSLGGATEATVWSNSYPVGEVDPSWPSIPYGRPMPNAQYHVLDAALSPCPIGVPGDLYIGGDCLCVGYAHQPDLTAMAFVPDPFGRWGSRLYRTGDRARTFTDGNLEFLGRIDHQVKIRGFRIELGEIEVALARHPGVREAVVLAREDVPGDKRLVAYVVLAAPQEEIHLREFLRRSLPDYMIPAAFVELEALPVTPNGKLDRRALPAPHWDHAEVAGTAPRTRTEQLLAALWLEILGVEHVSVQDSFFDLGGHSLLATQLVARVREAFRIEMPLRMIFQTPILEELARSLDAELAGSEASVSVLTPEMLAESLRGGLRPVPRTGLLPLSFPQQRLWLVEQLTPGSAAYNIPYAFGLQGPVHPSALASAFGEVVRRHEVLRTVFPERNGQPWQEIRPPAPFVLPLIDLAGLPGEERGVELGRLRRQEGLRPFDLASSPALRARLIRLSHGDHALLMTLHHIAFDGWSEAILLNELGVLYEPAALPDPAVQYADYGAWQRSWPEEVMAGRLAYWKDQLAGLTALELPTDRPRPPVQTFRGASVPIEVPASAAAALRLLARERNATLFMLLFAAWQTLLHRITGQSDVIVGSPVANREQPEIRGLIGFFVNLLPLRADFGARPSFDELLDQVRQTALEAYHHADVPFERLVDELRLQRDLSRHPIFQVLFGLQSAQPEPLRLRGLEVSRFSPLTEIVKFDLSLGLTDLEERGFAGVIEYNSDLFEHATVQRLAGHLGKLLGAISAAPGEAVAEIDVLTAEERRQILADWSQGPKTAPAEELLQEAFSARAAESPEALAVVWRDRRLSYGELDARSDRLAARLNELGVRPEIRVGLCARRTPDLIVGLLGILKAGGAYVPLDPEYPLERLAFTLEDASVPVLVTQQSLVPSLPQHEARVVVMDVPELDVPDVPDLPTSRPPCAAGPDNLAYLIYTSGSTGRPKGVAITHQSAAAMVRWGAGVFSQEDLAGVLAATSICFDLSVFEIFLPLSRGGTVILAANALELPELPFADAVTLVNTVPSAMSELVRTESVPPSVRVVNLAGEALPGALVDEIYGNTSVARVFNLYGPSEDTTYSTFAQIPRHTPAPSIGRPIDGTCAYVLDRSGLPVPTGVAGDLHLGGDGLARGYLARPDLTAERFVPDPFSNLPGGRLYRTGDLVKWLPDGNLQFLGRVDHQVKVRGFRVELGEIEAVLSRHPAVGEAVVAVRGETLSDRHLIAYVAPRAEKPAPGELREFLAARLPGPAVPSAFAIVDELPRTPNGKVNRRALPALEISASERTAPFVAPSTRIEEELASIWSVLLRVEHIGAHDNFFELGGHSLLASQLVARIRDTFGAVVPLSAVFQTPTLAALAELLTNAAPASPHAGPVLRPVARTGELPLSASQLRQWFLVQLDPESVDFNLPITVRLEGELQPESLHEALRALIRRHEALRTTFVSFSGRPAAVVAPEIDVTLPVLDLSATPESEQWAAILRATVADSDRPFDLTRGPLLRALLIRLGAREHLLAITFHHIIFDGFSTGVFLRELSALYQEAVTGQPAELPPLPVQYVDYAAWQREWLESPDLQARIERWQARLAGASQVLDIPTDRPRPAVLSQRGEVLRRKVDSGLTAEIRKLARDEGVTLFMVLLSGFASLLSRYTGQEDLNVGTFVANRRHEALERLIGFFVNTLVLRVDLTGNPSVRDLLRRVREMSLEAFENQDVPFERLLDELDTERDLSRGPLFQVMFGVQNFAMPTLQVPGLSFQPVHITEHSRVHGDLGFYLWEDGDGLSSLLQLSADLFDSSTVMRMFTQMERLLAAGAADPGLRISELPLLSAEERSEILVDWNRPGERELEPDALVHERFERWAELRPDAIALEAADGGASLTYFELNRRANHVAHRLRRLGVRTDSIVGIWAERSAEFVIGVLGVLKAGGAYMPLDPSLPMDRLAAIVRDSGISVLLARDGRPANLPAVFDGEVVALRGLAPALAEDDRNPAPLAVSESLAYVLFTSGSTGTPKGVLIGHSALANFGETARRLYGIGPNDRVLQFSSLVFDISVEEIFTSWAAGATLVLRTEEMVSSPSRFLRACGDLNVQMVDLPTAYWHELGVELARGEISLPRCVRSVILGGERALQERLAGWREAMLEGVRLFNTYGPTEATPVSSVFDPAELALGASTNGIAIGKPMRGTRLYVVDRELQPVPAGVAGELLIAGAGLGRGYAGRPDLTAEKFVPSPFAALPGERVYRTGDRVRWLTDGNLEFLGRVDDQVKIRGFRIEPGEIAAALCGHPAVREAVVVPRDSGPAGLRLVAYAAADPGAAVADLRDFLKQSLPAYMVPSDFVLLESLPLTATGKVDRRALPAPTTGEDDGYAPPETVTEELLAEIWAELLGRERVGIFDSFFDLGGHSLLAPQVFSRIEETFQLALPLRMLFEAPTIAQLATVVEREILAQLETLSDEEAESLLVGAPER